MPTLRRLVDYILRSRADPLPSAIPCAPIEEKRDATDRDLSLSFRSLTSFALSAVRNVVRPLCEVFTAVKAAAAEAVSGPFGVLGFLKLEGIDVGEDVVYADLRGAKQGQKISKRVIQFHVPVAQRSWSGCLSCVLSTMERDHSILVPACRSLKLLQPTEVKKFQSSRETGNNISVKTCFPSHVSRPQSTYVMLDVIASPNPPELTFEYVVVSLLAQDADLCV